MMPARLARRARFENAETRETFSADDDRFAQDLIAGLSREVKRVPSRYFYDARGSDLFEQITQLPEYYPTRTEIGILENNARDIAHHVGAQAVLVEFGSGSSRKTEILLETIADLRAYVSIDVSMEALKNARARLGRRFPALHLIPLPADFTTIEGLPKLPANCTTIGFFPGSTIGNFELQEAKELLDRFGRLLGPASRLIVGVDLEKDLNVLLRAYNDAAGVTAQFNLNLLAHANRRFGDVFDLDAFEHRAIYNAEKSRIEMHLVSKRAHSVSVFGRTFHFANGETLRTELSHKYTLERFARLAAGAGWRCERVWLDEEKLFSVQALRRVEQ